jgi:hypothetical protein
LYLNTGTSRLQEVACISGLEATDWTWSVRFEDLDNDGLLDLFVTNGMHREAHNADLIDRMMRAARTTEKIALEKATPVLNERNLAFKNLGGLRFVEVGNDWGLDENGVSFGCAFGDLDGDGDLDIVYSNFEKGLTLLRNDSQEGHRLVLVLHGSRSNRFGVGAKISLSAGGRLQSRTLTLARGVLSTSEPVVHFGLGTAMAAEWIRIEWPSGVQQTIENVEADARLVITEPASSNDGGKSASTPDKTKAAGSIRLTEVSGARGLEFSHREPAIDEQSAEPLLPMRQNWRGPAAASGMLADGRMFVVFGGTSRVRRSVRVQENGTFVEAQSAIVADNAGPDDGPILVFDANGDGNEDILLSKGGSASPAGSPDYQPSLWFGDGRGAFTEAAGETLPPFPESTGALAAADFDRNGTLDVFSGTRVAPGMYSVVPNSALWRNLGGKFEDVTDQVCPPLRNVGRVSSAVWTDFDGDGWPDLIVAVEWGLVRAFKNEKGKSFREITEEWGFATGKRGLWSSLAVADFNHDGRPDVVAGNRGLNTPYKAPLAVWCGDFRGNGTVQIVEGRQEGGRWFPLRSRRELGASVPSLLKKFPRTDLFAQASLDDIFGRAKLDEAVQLSAEELESGVFMSSGNSTCRFMPLPRMAQVAPVQGIAAGDFDGDGDADLILVQNNFSPFAHVGRFDGGLGQWLSGDGRGGFSVRPPSLSGLSVPGDGRGISVLDWNADGAPDFMITRNQAMSLAFERAAGSPARVGREIVLQQAAANAAAIGARVEVVCKSGARQCMWISADTGNYSQSQKSAWAADMPGDPIAEIEVVWPDGSVERFARGDDAKRRWTLHRKR